MKIVLTTTFLVAVLAISLFGMNNTFAQEGNNTMSMGNDTTGMIGKDYEDSKMMKLNGTIDVKSTMAEAFKSKVNVNIIDAITTAQSSVGANSIVKEAELTEAHGYLVYKITAVDENMKKYKVIVDPGNGQVLMKKEVTWCDEHDKMKYGDDERYDKYGSSAHGYGDDYDQKNMMMKDKKY